MFNIFPQPWKRNIIQKHKNYAINFGKFQTVQFDNWSHFENKLKMKAPFAETAQLQ